MAYFVKYLRWRKLFLCGAVRAERALEEEKCMCAREHWRKKNACVQAFMLCPLLGQPVGVSELCSIFSQQEDSFDLPGLSTLQVFFCQVWPLGEIQNSCYSPVFLSITKTDWAICLFSKASKRVPSCALPQEIGCLWHQENTKGKI